MGKSRITILPKAARYVNSRAFRPIRLISLVLKTLKTAGSDILIEQPLFIEKVVPHPAIYNGEGGRTDGGKGYTIATFLDINGIFDMKRW